MSRNPVHLNDMRRQDFLSKFSSSIDVLMSIIESSYDGIYITDGDANTLYINRSYTAVSGLEERDVLGKNMRDLIEAGIISHSGTLVALKKRRTVTLEQEFKTGRKALVSSTPVFNENNDIVMVVTNVRDQTELSELREQLEESSEMAQRYHSQIEMLRRQYQDQNSLIAVDHKMLDLIHMVDRVAHLDTPVLLLGETGVGKERVATYLYNKSDRNNQNFIKVNCGAISENLIESELFGYEPGAFTGAAAKGKIGYFEAADKGTIFLDEVGDLSLETQVKLLRVLQEQEVLRVGATSPVKIDVRVLAATHQDLEELVRQGRFREDLYYRLNVFPIEIPPLRERPGDISLLAQQMLHGLNRKYNRDKGFTQTAIAALQDYHWPGNVRELKNIVERAFIMSDADMITASDLPIQTMERRDEEGEGAVNLREKLERMEYDYILRAYRQHGNVRAAAKSLGMDPATYTRKRKRYGESYGGMIQN